MSASNWQDKIKQRNSSLRSPTEQAVFPMGTPGEGTEKEQTAVNTKQKNNKINNDIDSNSNYDIDDDSNIASNNNSDIAYDDKGHINNDSDNDDNNDVANNSTININVNDTSDIQVAATTKSATKALDTLLSEGNKHSTNKVFKGFYLDPDIAKVLDKLAKKHGKGIQSQVVNETLRTVFVGKGLM